MHSESFKRYRKGNKYMTELNGEQYRSKSLIGHGDQFNNSIFSYWLLNPSKVGSKHNLHFIPAQNKAGWGRSCYRRRLANIILLVYKVLQS